jgi:hypothetical protein
MRYRQNQKKKKADSKTTTHPAPSPLLPGTGPIFVSPTPHPPDVLLKLNMLASSFPLPKDRPTYKGYNGSLKTLHDEAADMFHPTPTGARLYVVPGVSSWRINVGPLIQYQHGEKRIEMRGAGYTPLPVNTKILLPCGYAIVSHVGGFKSASQFHRFVDEGGLEVGYGSLDQSEYERYGLTSQALDAKQVFWTALQFYDVRLV